MQTYSSPGSTVDCSFQGWWPAVEMILIWGRHMWRNTPHRSCKCYKIMTEMYSVCVGIQGRWDIVTITETIHDICKHTFSEGTEREEKSGCDLSLSYRWHRKVMVQTKWKTALTHAHTCVCEYIHVFMHAPLGVFVHVYISICMCVYYCLCVNTLHVCVCVCVMHLGLSFCSASADLGPL